MPDQSANKSDLGFLVIKDLPVGSRKPLTQSLTITSDTPTTDIVVTKIPDEAWIDVPGTIVHDTPFDVTAVPVAKEHLYQFHDRRLILRFTKALYDTLDVPVVLKSQPGGPPAGGGGGEGTKIESPPGSGEGKGVL